MSADIADRFFLVWTTPPASFQPRYFRAVQSIRRWHPHAAINVLSNTLPSDFFGELAVTVQRFSLEELTRNSPAAVWYSHRHIWNRSSYFSNHEADFLRLLTLWRQGGVYVDTDVIFLRPLRLPRGCVAAVGIESGVSSLARPAAHVDDEPSTYRPAAQPSHQPGSSAILCNAVMAFEAGAPLLARALDTFVHEYVPYTPGASMIELYARGEWGAMGPLLLTRLMMMPPDSSRSSLASSSATSSSSSTTSSTSSSSASTTATTTSSSSSTSACILEREALYPLEPAATPSHFGPWDESRDGPLWGRLHARSVTVHFWNGLTRDTPLHCGSLIHRLLEEHSGCTLPGAKCNPLPCT